ncbi:MAG: ABC transporter permease [Thermoguttaceae bacterium]|nr:ABC transporter permease [Thermoguttaceae bacterium]MDW8037923.1 ABC transporter permease [Thermoguttaceae bacterium]
MWQRIGRLIVKEFLVVLRDPRTRIILIVPPMVQLLVFTFAATHEVRNVVLGVYNEDHGLASRELLDRLHAIPETFSRIEYFEDLRSAEEALAAQRVLAVLHIGQTFSKELFSGSGAPVQLLLDGRRSNSAMILQGYLARIVEDFASQAAPGGRHSAGATREADNQGIGTVSVPARVNQAVAPLRPISRMWFNPNLNPIWSTLPGLVAVLSNLVALLITALSVAREKELGTFEQLLVSPLRAGEILIGKAVPAVVLGTLEGSLMITMAVLVFRLPLSWHGLQVLLVAMPLFLIAVVGIGLFVSSLAKTQQQGLLGAFTYQVPATLLSGFATPVENIADGLRWIAYVNPLQYMVSLSRMAFLEDPGWDAVLGLVWPMAPIGLVSLTAAAMLFRKATLLAVTGR